ncbi:aminotransferase class V-fold PLP-dependent enzyme [Marispirochaeta sp.]|uniref:aminotransferase class V-fold PLP-dependent enzyme n=1 Tax=Marispirochaeta sp. TaxID=2038653 RepID=UPI0029C96BB5|nr:aminotransferase class V-fold PLP-dependent enzyme [Marispirochaeta sp.]
MEKPDKLKQGSLEEWFAPFRRGIIGIDARIHTPHGSQPLVYADWIASGRLYGPIETLLRENIGPLVGNTHSESSTTGRAMTAAYREAHAILKRHVNAGPDDVIITAGSGMTAVVNKLQRILGIRYPERSRDLSRGLPARHAGGACDEACPVIFVTHMEHHSNHISWLETEAEVVVLPPDDKLEVDPVVLERELERYVNRPLKIGAFSACSNVTGLFPPYRELARIMHRHGGLAFIDFAASAPYVTIDMHPEGDPPGYLDGVFFSPHKFLGGPGSSGVMVFNSGIYHNLVPDNPGGGTVTWTNRWGERSYVTDIEAREDGGTPGFLQAIRGALAVRLKEEMDPVRIEEREKELVGRALREMRRIPGLHILADNDKARIGVISFYIEGVHHNLVVRLLNDYFGIQSRGGCSCAGTYGHFLLHVSRELSQTITREIDSGNFAHKPGWVRISLHPTMSDAELDYLLHALNELMENHEKWGVEYRFDPKSGEFYSLAAADGSLIAESDLRLAGLPLV